VRRLPWIEILLVLGAFAIMIAIGYERDAQKHETEYDTYSTLDTRSGGYSAWYEMLERERRAPQRFERHDAFLEGSIGTLIAADPLPFAGGVSVSEANAAALVKWVRAGGRLVVIGTGPLADAIQKDVKLPGLEKALKAKPVIAPELKRWGVRKLEPQTISRFEKAKGYDVLFGDARGAIVVRRHLDNGQVIAVADRFIFTNKFIGHADHARLAYALALSPRGAAVAFDESLHGYLVAEHWWQLVPRSFLIAVGLTLAAVALAAIGAAIRLGPPIVPRKRREATSSEYIDALAALFERARAAQRSMLDAYISTRRAVARRLGMADETPDGVLAAALPDPQTRAKFAELARLASEKGLKEPALIRGAALAYDIRKDVGRGGR
jgi:hypothetical protein